MRFKSSYDTWSRGSISDVVFGGKNSSLMLEKFNRGCAVQLSRKKITSRFCLLNFLFNSISNSSNIAQVIHVLELNFQVTGKEPTLMFLKQ